MCSAPDPLLLTRVLGSELGHSRASVPSTPYSAKRPMSGTCSHMARNAELTRGIASSRSFARCWQKAETVGALPFHPKASSSSTPMVSHAQVIMVQTSARGGIFLSRARSLAGSFAHASGTEHTSCTARPGRLSASSAGLFPLLVPHLLAAESVAASVAASPFSAREARKTISGTFL